LPTTTTTTPGCCYLLTSKARPRPTHSTPIVSTSPAAFGQSEGARDALPGQYRAGSVSGQWLWWMPAASTPSRQRR
jgi:hypothetical protein